MPTLTPFHLDFPDGIHLGRRGTTLEEAGEPSIPSDTLYAAVIDIWSRLGYDVAGLLQPFVDGKPPFLLTSAFPRVGDLRFFPLPRNAWFDPDSQAFATYGKRLKNISYISEGLVARFAAGESIEDLLFPVDAGTLSGSGRGGAFQNGVLWFLTQEAENLPAYLQTQEKATWGWLQHDVWQATSQTRVTVDRGTTSSAVHHSKRTFFSPECGLWFGVQWAGEANKPSRSGKKVTDYTHALLTAIAMLGEEGIGGERSSGCGGFHWINRDARIPLDIGGEAQPGKPLYLLSRYLPTRVELPQALSDPRAAYRLQKVGGWLHSPGQADQRRKHLMLISEGSIVVPPQYPAGTLCDLRPTTIGDAIPHPVYRVGFGLGIPLVGTGA